MKLQNACVKTEETCVSMNSSVNLYPHSNDTVLQFLHRKYGHLSYKTLKSMIKAGKIPESEIDVSKIDLAEYNKCETCVLAKHHHLPYKKREKNIYARPLSLVHTDVCEVLTESYDHCKYFVSFIDDASSFKCAYPIIRKSDVYKKFLEYEKFTSTLFEEKYEICALKCDRGGEYRSGELVIYCEEKGINIKYTPVKEKQLHGKAEIFNRHVCEKARAMLFDSGLPKALWSEAVKYAAFVMNRCETQDCEQTPAEIAYGNNASFHRMRIFGCRAYSLVKEPSDKMSERSTRMFFVGVGEGTYRLYDPKTRKVDEFRNVEFDEKWV